ncbi:tetratricopeptide repeat protein [Lewinella sp. IMCC34183]|uniref:tetratricopeptide repeat protein n=1 Tax=Lewinella sp. IMCC34183 TaxID=2248762 RepID=UPI000E276975|nr:tetratricopeptide repeat protein [Lewinella sp. IMCC34183]
MRRLLPFMLLAACFASPLVCQELRGVVLNQSNDSQPEAGVKLTFLVGNANPETTNGSGLFHARLSGVTDGDPVEIIVQKEGFVLLGPDETIFRMNMPKGQESIRIAIASREAFNNLKADYVIGIEKRLARAERERQSLINRLGEDALDDNERKALTRTISQQSQEIETLRSSKEELAQQLARIDLDEASGFARNALKKFQEDGDVEGALAMMTAERVDEFWENVSAQEEEVKRAKIQGIENYMIRARLLAADFAFAEADSMYRKAIGKDSSNFQNIIEYGEFLHKQHEILRGIEFYKQIRFSSLTSVQQATVMNNLGNLYLDGKRFSAAELAYEEALALRRELVSSDSTAHVPSFAISLSNLGNLHRENKRYAAAESAYKEALAVRREMVSSNPGAYTFDLANSLNNLGVLYSDIRRFTEAESAYEEAVGLYRELASNNFAVYSPSLAMSLNNLGVLYSDIQRFVEAESAYDEAVGIRRELALSNPAAYSSDLATSLNNLGVLYSDVERFVEAESAYDEAVGILRELALSNPAAYSSDLLQTLRNLGALYHRNKRYSAAESAFDEALYLGRELVLSNSPASAHDLAKSLNNLGVFYSDIERFAESESAYDEAVGLYRELALSNRAAYLPDLAYTLNNLGKLYRDNRRYGKAESAFDEAIALRRELALSNPAAYSPYLASSLNNLGLLYSENEGLMEAGSAYNEAIAL